MVLITPGRRDGLQCNNDFISQFTENRGIHNKNLFEGDMRLTPEQRRKAEMGLDVDSTSTMKRGSYTGPLWPDGVLIYTIERDLGMLFIIYNNQINKKLSRQQISTDSG